jgi:hypothetical protein
MRQRLVWDPTDWGNITFVPMNSRFVEEPEIWLSDITAYNARKVMEATFQQK